MTTSVRLLLLTALLLLGGASSARAQRVAATLRAGTDGPGVSIVAGITRTLNARVQAGYLTFRTDGRNAIEDVDFDYDATGTILLGAALADWHPFANAFRLTGGLYLNGVKGNGKLVAPAGATVGTRTYSAEQIGELDVDVSFGSPVAPYLGIGLGNPLNHRVGVTLDVGALYQGSPTVEIHGTGMLEAMQAEAARIEQNVSWAKFYPVVSLGLSVGLF